MRLFKKQYFQIKQKAGLLKLPLLKCILAPRTSVWVYHPAMRILQWFNPIVNFRSHHGGWFHGEHINTVMLKGYFIPFWKYEI